MRNTVDWKSSVIAVPPLCRRPDYSLDPRQNQKLIRHIEDGGVTTLLYGGNANLYHCRPSEYASLLAMLTDSVSDTTVVIPSVGPSHGVMMDQAAVLRKFNFPTAMLLPQTGMTTTDGIVAGVRSFVEGFGRPILLYVKHDGFIDVSGVATLYEEGLISGIKYAIVRDNPAEDVYLRELVQHVDPSIVISGIGEQPAITHLREFGLAGFTSGCVCIAPKLSMAMLASIRRADWSTAEQIRAQFSPLEDLRNAINPVRVLHRAVSLCQIADTGPHLPLLSELSTDQQESVSAAACDLLELNREAVGDNQPV